MIRDSMGTGSLALDGLSIGGRWSAAGDAAGEPGFGKCA